MTGTPDRQPQDVTIPIFRLRRDGGVERYTWEVAAHLARGGSRVRVVCGRGGYAPKGVETEFIGTAGPINTYRSGLAFTAFPVRARVRIALAHKRSVVYGPVGSMLPPGVVTSLAVHAAWVRARARYFEDSRLTMFDRSQLAVEWLTFHLPRKVVTALSPSNARDLSEIYGVQRDSIVIVPPAIDPAEFSRIRNDERDRCRARWKIDPSAFVVGIAANYAFLRKGVTDLIEACARTDATLLLAGLPDRQYEHYEALARTSRADVRFLGAVDDMRSFYGALDVFALPSVYEAYGMAAHEAMGCGIATIVSSVSGISEVADRTRDLATVEPRDVDGLAATVAALRDDTRRRDLAEHGARWAHSRTWGDVASEIAAVLRTYQVSG
jgi:UDP-glucose:(heptosyl)LPS alpha-1,3-glucosyltransferase